MTAVQGQGVVNLANQEGKYLSFAFGNKEYGIGIMAVPHLPSFLGGSYEFGKNGHPCRHP